MRKSVLAGSLALCLLPLLGQAAALAQEAAPGAAGQEQQAQELAKKLANPVSSLVNFPVQINYDTGFGPTGSGSRLQANVQPVIPIGISKNWNMISRTITPIISQTEMTPGSGRQFGLGDITQSLFFSPAAPTGGGLIWGAGPVMVLPTATDDLLGGDKWGLGPTFVVLKQQKQKTVGLLANHVWSVAGNDTRPDVSSTFLQPFYSITTPGATTYTLNTEAGYDWKSEEWSIPINLSVSQLTRFGKQPVSVGIGLRYWADSPPNGPSGFGLRLVLAYLFPK